MISVLFFDLAFISDSTEGQIIFLKEAPISYGLYLKVFSIQ